MSLTAISVLYTTMTYLFILSIGSPSRNLSETHAIKTTFFDTPPTFCRHISFQIQYQPPFFQIRGLVQGQGQSQKYKTNKSNPVLFVWRQTGGAGSYAALAMSGGMEK